MILETFTFDPENAWSLDTFPQLDGPNSLVVVFGGAQFLHQPEALEELKAAYPQSTLVGCSTSGEICGDTVRDQSLSVAVIQFEKTALAKSEAKATKFEESYGAGKTLAESLLAPHLKAVLVFSDGLHVNGSELVRGLNSVLPQEVVVTGGLAGDGDRFKGTWVLSEGIPRSGVISAIGLYGNSIHVGHGSQGGWDIFGPERRITRSEGNVLYELDGRPALELYKSYLGEKASELPASALLFPLALRSEEEEEKRIVRTVLSIDEEEQSMTFAGDVPENSLVQLMRANFDRLIDGAGEAGLRTREGFPDHESVLAIAISCVGRRLILGERAEEELEASLETLPPGSSQIGFYSYGEISPFASGHCDLHNQTMTLTTLSED
ncbi:MAG: hypothetical protein DWQ01_05635 [Planctomycetota bacterium]|nr:MAG: hypothetical protein DWQ01_05635 [Planctomycetota bacterium]